MSNWNSVANQNGLFGDIQSLRNLWQKEINSTENFEFIETGKKIEKRQIKNVLILRYVAPKPF